MRHNISNFMLIWVARRKLCPIRRTETETATGFPFSYFGGGISIGILHLLGWYFVSLSLFIDLFFVPPPLLPLSSSLSFFFYHSRILFVCLFLIRFIYFYLCWARRFVSFRFRCGCRWNLIIPLNAIIISSPFVEHRAGRGPGRGPRPGPGSPSS